jgi:predicted GNAT family acetyltransferase
MSEPVVRDNPERSRYELVLGDDVVGIADYRVSGEQVTMPHTETDPAHRGQGYGAILVRGALDDVRRAGRTVVPACWYVAEFIGDNPEYADLVAAGN